MVYKFSKKSLDKLDSCDPLLKLLFTHVIKTYDCTILEGYRDSEVQNHLFETEKSKVRGGNSKHNFLPSLAVDVSPYPIPTKWGADDFKELAKFYFFAGYVCAIAKQLDIDIRWGGDWDSDKNFNDQTFDDLVHFELIK